MEMYGHWIHYMYGYILPTLFFVIFFVATDVLTLGIIFIVSLIS